MAYTTINKSSDHFKTLLYSGTGSARTVTGVGFQPDFFWIKQRSSTQGHLLWDVTRGGNYYLPSSSTSASAADIGTFTAASDGYSFNTDGAYNGNSQTYVGWNWKAGGSTSTNNDGATATAVSVNATAGISLVNWTGTSGNTTIGHGLGTTPTMIIMKNAGGSGTNWVVYHKNLTSGYFLKLNTTAAHSNSNTYFTADPTSSILSLTGGTAANNNGNAMIAYCFTDIPGYSRFGHYMGNGNVDGPFVYTGFAPSFVIQREVTEARDWTMIDNTRSTINVADDRLVPNENAAEVTNNDTDLLSNGFKCRRDQTNTNEAGKTYIYMAFGQSIVGSNNVPTTAR